MAFAWLTDAELIERTKQALDEAHNAPLRAYRLDADGHRWVEGGNSYSFRANEWHALSDEVARRRLVHP